MATTTLKTRIQHKYNTPAKWAEDTSFVPLKGEICVFNNGAGVKPEMKIGDGTTTLASLPFLKAGSDIQINSGSANGTISVSIDGSAKDVAVKGLGARAFDSTEYIAKSYDGTQIITNTHSGGDTSLALQTNSAYSWLRFNSKDATLGFIGFESIGHLRVDTRSGTYDILHSGNTITSGYNLCYGTKNADGWSHNFSTTSATSQKETHNGVQYVRFIKDNQTETSWKYTMNKNLDLSKLKDNTYYTVSFDVCSSVSGSIILTGIMTPSAQYGLTSEISYLDNVVTAGVWKRVSFRFKTVNSIANVGLHGQGVYLSTPAITPNSEIVLGRLCVQEGIVPGSYTDYESYYDNITSNNYTSYTVTKTGSGASGTWGINITGSSASCTGNAATATTAAKLGRNGSTATPMIFNWSGQDGQPTWLWGGADGTNMYVYNPSNFSVNYANSCGTSTSSSWLNTNSALTYGASGLNYFNASLGTTASASSNYAPTADWYHIIRMNHSNASGYYVDLAACFHSDNLYIKRVASGTNHGYKHVWVEGNSVTSAVWNDYAEYRESDCAEFGRVLAENGDDTLSATTERLQHFAGISSDTWGFCQGETEKAKTPIAVAGRVLAYPYRDRNEYKPGDCVCAAPNGTVDIMTREEVEHYPDRIVGTVSCVPEYEEWGQGDRPAVKVDGRIWVKVR